MKKLIGYIGSWTLYWLGDFTSRPMHSFDWAWLYPTYNNLMLWSSDIQEWAGNETPWREEEKEK